jgi:hypothetical protein
MDHRVARWIRVVGSAAVETGGRLSAMRAGAGSQMDALRIRYSLLRVMMDVIP